MPQPPYRIVFAGTPEFAAASLDAMIKAGYSPIAVYTQPDRPAGRGQKLQHSPVKTLALQHDVPVFQPQTLRDPAAQEALRALQPDLMVVAAYGLILPAAVLDIPRFGCINVHASLLPRWRGAAPIHRAIAAGDGETGITIMQMDVGLDTGAMLLKHTTPIHPDDTSSSLHDRLATLGGVALIEALKHYPDDPLPGIAQDETQACYAAKLAKEEGRLDWALPAAALERKVRAFDPWPGTFIELPDQRIRVTRASVISRPDDAAPGKVLQRDRQGIAIACGDGALLVTGLQLPGARAMSVADLINGGKEVLIPGTQLAAGAS